MGSTAKQTNQIYQEPSRWYRRRGFGLGPFGEKWWVAPLNRDKIAPMDLDEIPVTAAGMEVIQVCVQSISQHRLKSIGRRLARLRTAHYRQLSRSIPGRRSW